MSIHDIAQRYLSSGAQLTPALDAAAAATKETDGWSSVASWIFRRAVEKRTQVLEEAGGVLMQAGGALHTLGYALEVADGMRQQGEYERQTALQTNPLMNLLDQHVGALFDTPGEALIRQAAAERTAAFQRAAAELMRLAERAPAAEAAAAAAVEAEARKEGINARVEVEDGRITGFKVDNLEDLSTKQKWLALGLTPEGEAAKEGLKEDWGYNDGLTSWKTWSPVHAAGRMGIAHLEGDRLRTVLEAVGIVPLPVGRVGSFTTRVVKRRAPRVTAKVTAKAAPLVQKVKLPKITSKSKRRRPVLVRTTNMPLTPADLPRGHPSGMLKPGWLFGGEPLIPVPRKPGAKLTRSERRRQHIVREHIAVTDADLVKRLADNPGLAGASRFTSRAIAERSIERVVAGARGEINGWLANQGTKLVIKGHAGRVVGHTITRGDPPTKWPVTHVVVVLLSDGRGGFRIQTAYPDPYRPLLAPASGTGQLSREDD